MAAAVRLLDMAATTSEQERQEDHGQQYSFKPISSPLTYSVRDSADSLDSDSTERSFGFTGAVSRVAPIGERGRFTGQEHAHWRGDALQFQAADSDIESDISPQQSPPKPRRSRRASSGLSVLPLGKREEHTADGEREEAEGAAAGRRSPRDSGLYSHSPSNNGEDHAMGATTTETDVGPSRKLSLPDTAMTKQDLDMDRGHADLVVSPSAVSVRMTASDELNSPVLDRFSPLGAENRTQESTLNASRADSRGMRKSSSHRPIFLARARESRLQLLQSGGIEEFSTVAAEQLQRDSSLSQSPSTQTFALGYRATPVTAVEQTQGISSVSKPSNPRVVGRVVKTKAGSIHQVELHKPQDGPFGFVIAKGTVNDKTAVYVSAFRGGYPEKFFTGLLRVGDKIVAVNGIKVKRKSLDGVHELMRSSDPLLLTVKPKLLSSDW